MSHEELFGIFWTKLILVGKKKMKQRKFFKMSQFENEIVPLYFYT